MSAYSLLGRLLRPFALTGFFIYNRATGRPRSRVIITDRDDNILLVRNWIGSGKWSLPGGGIGRTESAVQAARREVKEELGILLDETALHYVAKLPGYQYPAYIFSVRISDGQKAALRPRRLEITHAEWYSPGSLPDVSRLTRDVISSRHAGS